MQAALKQLPKNKVPSMAVMIKTLTRTNVDAGAVFRDPTGKRSRARAWVGSGLLATAPCG